MSDSEQRSEAAIAKKLQDVVISLHKAGNTDDLTVKRVRTRAEEQLGLPAGFLKAADWKQKSQDAIMEAVDKYCGDEPEPEPVKAAPKASKPKVPAKKPAPAGDSKQGAKRKAPAPKKQPQKRRKTTSSEVELSDELSDADSEPEKKPARRAKNVVEEDSDEEEAAPKRPIKKTKPVVDDEDDSDAEPTTTPPRAANKDDVSESELSSLLDESPAKSKRQKKAPAAKKKEPAKPKPKAASKAADDPDQAEIKRLQSWLVKCGIRKVWSKELAKFDTSKEKIRQLKEMLSDAGMDGRFSDEKAAKIKEKREFAKDLEAIQEGEASWGNTEDTGGRPRRRAAARPAAPVQKIEFSDDSEESEENNDDGDDSSEDDLTDDDGDDGKGASEDDAGDDSAADDSE
ncbi:uncharacterized protein EKO05_0000398 [Ascochyta rabiei]|uniref:Uncharacterized protein n=1 Tax=Didymella rabiei TaxID=5454 RepID=A0A163BPH4_DIDRA|nr:uncharacterized protein EKO05_0000398 [Ascochyta rabiei]KZM21897.1 hypothetical protein ST47_g6934 [Ascochyta rabiei]UPX09714.1 hypothetical protein EKO05_0000398 [Ascochyta rabiei]